METKKEKCCQNVVDSGSYHSRKCSHNAKVVRNGKHYCGIHDPVAVAKRDKQKQERWDKKINKRKEEFKRQSILKELAKDIPTDKLGDYKLFKKD